MQAACGCSSFRGDALLRHSTLDCMRAHATAGSLTNKLQPAACVLSSRPPASLAVDTGTDIGCVACCMCWWVSLCVAANACDASSAAPISSGSISCAQDKIPSGGTCAVTCSPGYTASSDNITCMAGSFSTATCSGTRPWCHHTVVSLPQQWRAACLTTSVYAGCMRVQ